jgi:hypothetical protein
MKLLSPSSLFFTIPLLSSIIIIRGAQGATFAVTCTTPTLSGVQLCAFCKNSYGQSNGGCLNLDDCFYNLDGMLEPGSE